MSRFCRVGSLALLAATAITYGCGDGTKEKSGEAAASSEAAVHEDNRIRIPENSPLRNKLTTAAVAQQTVERPIIAPGFVEADPAKLVKILTPISGRIERLHKGLGDPVAAGEPLFTLDSADFAQAQGDAAKAQSVLELTTRNLERLRKLAVDDIAARKDVEQAESDHAQARVEAERTRARLAQLGLVPGQIAGRQYTLRSPIAGHVVELTGAQGGYWNDLTAPIMTVADLSSVWLTANVQEKDLGAVYVGQAAKIAFNAYEGSEIDGRVKYLGRILDADTRTVKVRIGLDNASGRFRPNMFARVVLRGQPHPAVVVPATAVIQSGFNARVFVEVASWVFEPRVVKIGVQLGDRVEILEGLKTGERFLVKDGVLLND